MARTLRIEGRTVPFDAELGRDEHGHTLAVYSRCATEPYGGSNQGIAPARNTGEGCDLYEYVFATGTERKLRAVSTPGASEYLPTIDGRYIAFARRFENRRGRAGLLPAIELYDSRTRRTVRLPGGTPGWYRSVKTPNGPVTRGGPGPGRLSLRGRKLVSGWEYLKTDCVDGSEVQAAEISVIDLRTGEAAPLTSGTCIEDNEPSSATPTLDAKHVFYLSRTGGVLVQRDFSGTTTADAVGFESALAVAGGSQQMFAVRHLRSGGYTIDRATPAFSHD